MHRNLNAQSSQPDKVDIYSHPSFKCCDNNFIKTLGTISRKITYEKGQVLFFRAYKWRCIWSFPSTIKILLI